MISNFFLSLLQRQLNELSPQKSWKMTEYEFGHVQYDLECIDPKNQKSLVSSIFPIFPSPSIFLPFSLCASLDFYLPVVMTTTTTNHKNLNISNGADSWNVNIMITSSRHYNDFICNAEVIIYNKAITYTGCAHR